MSSIPEDFLKKVQELFILYDKVKICIIYAENFDPKHELYIAPINELRSSLDHFFKAAAHTDSMGYELKEAEEHLDRAGYDAFEILASNLGDTIIEKLKGYSTDTLTSVFSEYFTIIKPKLIEVRANLGEIRKRKKNNAVGSDESFSSYFDQVFILLDFNKMVDSRIPSLEEYHQKKLKEKFEKAKQARKERIKDRLYNTIVVGIVVAILSSVVAYFITNYYNNKRMNIQKTEIKNK